MTVPAADLVLPSYDDAVVAGAVTAVGGPPGRHARLGGRRFWTPVRVLVVLTLVTMGLDWAQKAPCRNGNQWTAEHQYTHACYTDVVALFSSEGLVNGQVPYLEHPVEYPVVTGGVMQLSALLGAGLAAQFPDGATRAARGVPDSTRSGVALAAAEDNARGRHFYDVTWLLLTVCALVVTVSTARLAGRRPWDAALFALAPGLLLHGTTNWDLVAVALAGLGLLLWARSRPVAAGVLLGLATATKLYPVLFLAPLLVLCLRADRLRAWTGAALALVGTAVALTVPVYLASPSFVERKGAQVELAGSAWSRLPSEGLAALTPHHSVAGEVGVNAVYRFFDLSTRRGADWDSLYLQVQHLQTAQPDATASTLGGVLHHLGNAWAGVFDDPALVGGKAPVHLNTAVAVTFLLTLALLSALLLAAPRRPRVPQALFLTLVAFLLTNKVDSPQYVLWLIPLAVLARPRWRPFLAWQAAEVLVLFTRFYFFIANDQAGGIGIGWFFAAVLLRDALLLAYAALVVRDLWRPEHDVVRRDGVDDPAGGLLDGAPDRPRLPWFGRPAVTR